MLKYFQIKKIDFNNSQKLYSHEKFNNNENFIYYVPRYVE